MRGRSSGPRAYFALITFCILSIPVEPAFAQEGLRTVAFDVEGGRVQVHLPADLRAGDRISGTVSAEPAGRTEAERRAASSRLQGYVVDVGGSSAPLSGGILTWTLGAAKEIEVQLRDRRGRTVRRERVPLAPASGAAAGPGPESFQIPALGQTGRPLAFRGPFDGDLGSTMVTVSGQPLDLLAEGPRQLWARAPSNAGPAEVRLQEGERTTQGTVRLVGVDLAADRLGLQRSERTRMTVTVRGLEGLEAPIDVRVTNESPQVVRLEGGDSQTINIAPSQVDGNGTFTWQRELEGIRLGDFGVSADLDVPSTSPTSQPASQPADEPAFQVAGGQPAISPECDGSGFASWQLRCTGRCPDGKPCRPVGRLGDDGRREWCGCQGDRTEPQGCHLTMLTPREGEPRFVCGGDCPAGEQCTLELQSGPLTPQGYRKKADCVCRPIAGTDPPQDGEAAPAAEGGEEAQERQRQVEELEQQLEALNQEELAAIYDAANGVLDDKELEKKLAEIDKKRKEVRDRLRRLRNP